MTTDCDTQFSPEATRTRWPDWELPILEFLLSRDYSDDEIDAVLDHLERKGRPETCPHLTESHQPLVEALVPTPLVFPRPVIIDPRDYAYLELLDRIVCLVIEPHGGEDSTMIELGHLDDDATRKAVPPQFLPVYQGWVHAREDAARERRKGREDADEYRAQVQWDFDSTRGVRS